MLVVGVVAVVAGLVMIRFREHWARQTKVILAGLGLKSLAAKSVEFWARLAIVGITAMWAAGGAMIVIGVVSLIKGPS